MPVPIGSRLGPYEILAAIGAGGMGEVFRARDTKLGRDVAIKVLPDAFARDADRMARFQREAKVLASLNHTNIAAIHGLEDSGSTHALVMQLAEGPTLADRIAQGALPIEDALKIARQIADALEYAHEKGIIHRDLKPANIKVAPDDTVKILDFGLAKAMESGPSEEDIANSPTLSRLATQTGVLLGTAAYMSPEQAKAKPADRRADIWAFGCVLYEMLTGKKAFEGEAVTETLAAVLTKETDWSLLPAATPIRVRVLLQRCLQKDVRQRLQAIGEARISIEEALSGAPQAAAPLAAAPLPVWRRAIPWGLATAFAIAFAIAAWALWREGTASIPPEPIQFQIPLPATIGYGGAFALSPDGKQLAFDAVNSNGSNQIWVRSLDSLEAHPLPGTEASGDLGLPFWSPDSRFIGFSADGKLKKVEMSTDAVETLCDLPQRDVIGGSWNRDGVIIFGQPQGALLQVSSNGGAPTRLTVLSKSRGETHHILPSFLPDGRHFLYQRISADAQLSGIYVGSLDARPQEQDSKPLVPNGFHATYVPSPNPDSGYLLFVRDGVLMAQSLDARSMALGNGPITLLDHVGVFRDYSYYSDSMNGVLAYRTGSSANSQLRWFDRQGKVVGTPLEEGSEIYQASLNPQATVAAITRANQGSGTGGLWLVDLSRGTSTRFTLGSDLAVDPVWSPDGSRVIFTSNRAGNFDLYEKLANGVGNEKLLLKSDEGKIPTSWSRDGRFLLYTIRDPKIARDSLWALPLEGDKKPFAFLRTGFNEDDGQFSPDGRWIAYTSDESGRNEVYVESFSPSALRADAGSGTKVLISTQGGSNPRWRSDGRELYYVSPDGMLMAVEVESIPTFRAGLPKTLFRAPQPAVPAIGSSWWDVTQDGNRFLFPAPPPEQDNAPFNVVLNWLSLLKK